MKLIDLILIILIISYCAYVIYKQLKYKTMGCNHSCSGCSSASLCHIDFDKIRQEIKEKE